MQNSDPNLDKYWKLAREAVSSEDDSKVSFIVKNDVLYRHYKNGPTSEVIEQIMLPEPLIDRVIR